jgi:hypothetical protein
MKKFDLVFEKLSRMIKEQEDYIENTFADNIRLMVSKLKDSGYLPDGTQVDGYTQKIMKQPSEVKAVVLDTQDGSIPRIKVLMKQIGNQEEPDTEDFSVTIVPIDDPSKQKEFSNTMLETVFDDAANYIKQLALKGLAPESAVEELPQEENPANQQQGAEASALPGVTPTPAPKQ